ncbi:MAG TPA: hypothetical protein VHN98_11425 [Acidimicrobiales bacterium]|nr:hypothetical protein [Acidimicrobiales bacterium]
MSFGGGGAIVGRLVWMLVPWRWRRRARFTVVAVVVGVIAVAATQPALLRDAWSEISGGGRRLDGPVTLIPTHLEPAPSVPAGR